MTEKIKRRESRVQDEFRWYRRHGGKLSEPTYKFAMHSMKNEEFSSSTRSQAIHMMRNIPVTESGRPRRYINSSATTRLYSMLREPMEGECAGWSDQKIFAEVLLMLHYVAGNAAFEQKYPNIFHNK